VPTVASSGYLPCPSSVYQGAVMCEGDGNDLLQKYLDLEIVPIGIFLIKCNDDA
jgi:hypothetical protein